MHSRRLEKLIMSQQSKEIPNAHKSSELFPHSEPFKSNSLHAPILFLEYLVLYYFPIYVLVLQVIFSFPPHKTLYASISPPP